MTDGLGWKTVKRPLEETFNNNDFIFNLNMLKNEILNELIKGNELEVFLLMEGFFE